MNAYEQGRKDAGEKYAATAEQLHAAAKRIGPVDSDRPGEAFAERTTPQLKALNLREKRLGYKPVPAGELPPGTISVSKDLLRGGKTTPAIHSMATIHEGFERQTKPSEMLPIRAGEVSGYMHNSPRVLLNENNLLAGATGQEAQHGASVLKGMRAGSFEDRGVNDLVRKAYGGRFPFTFGETKLPKAMRNNLMERLLSGKLRMPYYMQARR